MIGDSIKKLRKEKNMTQKELADKLYVTAQAVSRWENGEVEPSVSTIAEMAKIFNVSGDYILGIEQEPDTQQETASSDEVINNQEVVQTSQQVLALCENCNSPIYNKDDIKRYSDKTGSHILCEHCMQERNEEIRKRKQRDIDSQVALGKRRRYRALFIM